MELAPPEPTLVTGIVVNGVTGLVCGGCPVSLTASADAFNTSPYRLKTDKEGGFAIRGLPPRRYVVSASGGDRTGAFAVQTVEVVNGIAAAVAVTTGPGVQVRGKVVIDDTPSEDEDNSPALQVILTPTADARISTTRAANVSKETFEFTVSGVAPGEYGVALQNLPAGSYLEAVALSGRRLPQPALTIADSSIDSIQLSVSPEGASVAGVVETDDARPGVVVLMPSAHPWGYRVPLRKRYEEDRSFRFQGVPPGSYLLYAIPDRDAYDIYDPAVREDLKKFAVRITLERGANVTLEPKRAPEPRY